MGRFLVNHLDKRGSSLIEIMAMMAVLGIAVAAMFSTVIGGIYFAKDSETKIKAINLAREGIEGITNLRNTNWLRFSSDQINCWRIEGYQSNCIGNSSFALNNSVGTGGTATSYVLENKNGAWYLTGTTSGSGLWVDNNGFYYSSGITAGDIRCNFDITTNCRSPFTRIIRIFIPAGSTGSMSITSRVDWFERRAQNVIVETTLTNWKSKF
ncbi:type II secretion system GspH family protein [Candidatus Gracilibacteria bacterium]|nr:type II secretion system GspH family protein [Candidatus Gracilibacteria bacterium]